MLYIFKTKGKRGLKRQKNKEKKKQKRKELEKIHDRVQYMGTYLKKNEKGKDEYFVKWKDIELE